MRTAMRSVAIFLFAVAIAGPAAAQGDFSLGLEELDLLPAAPPRGWGSIR